MRLGTFDSDPGSISLSGAGGREEAPPAIAGGPPPRLDIYDILARHRVHGYGGLDSMQLPTPAEINGRRKRGRFWMALHSGLYLHSDDEIRFLTLTSPRCPVYLPTSFKRLRSALYRKQIRFEYISQRTAEGNGVYHILAAGDFIPAKWLHDTWNRVHGIPSGYHGNVQLDIKFLDTEEGRDKTARYLLKQYLNNQPFIRHDTSRGWLWPGWREQWRHLVKVHPLAVAKLEWQRILDERKHPTLTPILSSFGA